MDPMTWFSTPGPIATVAPDDLRKVWTFYLELEKQSGDQCCAVDIHILSSVCSPGADVEAVWYRVSQLELLSKVNRQFAAYLHREIPEDRIFEIAATFPMEKWQADEIHHAFPFDAEEFMRRIEAASGSST